MRNRLLKIMKVPAEPTIPAGGPGSARVFRAARNFYRLLLIKWGMKQIGLLVGLIFSLLTLRSFSEGWNDTLVLLVTVAEGLGIAGFILQIPFSLLLVKFDFELRWYIVTDRSLRIRAGIWEVREMTMTFANIQQLSVHQGPLQRLLGISDLRVQTAGGGSGGEESGQKQGASQQMHVGCFRGVDHAEEIRDLIKDRMKRLRDTGLGDPDEIVSALEEPVAVSEPEFVTAAREFADEAAALRIKLTRPESA